MTFLLKNSIRVVSTSSISSKVRFFGTTYKNGASSTSSKASTTTLESKPDIIGSTLSTRGASWYDPSSIERRLNKVRGPPRIDPVTGEEIRRGDVKKSEEEMWFEAGVYDYPKEEELKKNENVVQVDRTTTPLEEAMKDVSLFSQGRGTLVRVSTAEVHRRQLSSFSKAFELVALPAYKQVDGLVSIRLLIDDDNNIKEDVKEEDVDIKPYKRFSSIRNTNSSSMVLVTNITEWIDLDSLQRAIETEAYKEAMKILGSFFRGKTSVKNTTQLVAFDVRFVGN
jgi:hypothetical protein